MLLLKNVKIVAPASDHDGQISDILINKNGDIEKIGSHLAASKNTTIFEKQGTCVSIGWLDVGVQTGDPGFEHREDLASTAKAAMAGGFTAIAPFPNTQPTVSSKSEILYIKNKTQSYLVDFYPIGAVSEDCKGKDIAEMVDMHHAGAIAFSDGRKPLQDGGLLLRAVQYAQIFDGLVFNFPFDKTIAPHGQMHEGMTSTSLGLPAIPSLAEELMVQRDLQLIQYADARLHFHNISTARSVEFIRQAKKQGLKITASVAAINLCFDDSTLSSFNTYFKVMPPLREKTDIEALIKGLKDGTIDFINSNHTPIDNEGKDLEFPYADFGAIGLETAFAMTNQFLHKKVNINQLIENFAINSRKVLGIKIPHFTEGVAAKVAERFKDSVSMRYLDACFPFWDGFPLVPHLTHNDGRKLDIAFYYTQFLDNQPISDSPSWLGYGVSEEPRAGEENQPEFCREKGEWQYSFMRRYIIPQNWKSDFRFDAKKTTEMLRLFTANSRVRFVLIEPHLKTRLGFQTNNKIRIPPCHAVRHDDHIHVVVD